MIGCVLKATTDDLDLTEVRRILYLPVYSAPAGALNSLFWPFQTVVFVFDPWKNLERNGREHAREVRQSESYCTNLSVTLEIGVDRIARGSSLRSRYEVHHFLFRCRSHQSSLFLTK